MPRAQATHKHYRLNERKIKRAQEILGAKTETETIERALDQVISEEERDRLLLKAHQKFFASRIRIRDVYGNLEN
jgi:hypothetical protein